MKIILYLFCGLLFTGNVAFAGKNLIPFQMDISEADIEKTDLYAKAENGDADAQYNLALYYTGLEKKDYEIVVMWLRKAAQKGHLEAQFALGKIYQFGRGKVYQDLKESVYWYEKAANQGDVQAATHLQVLSNSKGYQLDRIPNSDDKWDVQWIIKTAQQGDVQSQFDLGRLYQEGKKIKMNYKKAFSWYYQAADKGHQEAMLALAGMYLEGKGTKANPQMALSWYEQAADLDNNLAQRKLFNLYKQPPFENLVLAYKWLYLSLMEIFPDADNLGDFSPELLDLEKRLTPDEKTSAFKQINDFLNRRRPYVFEK